MLGYVRYVPGDAERVRLGWHHRVAQGAAHRLDRPDHAGLGTRCCYADCGVPSLACRRIWLAEGALIAAVAPIAPADRRTGSRSREPQASGLSAGAGSVLGALIKATSLV